MNYHNNNGKLLFFNFQKLIISFYVDSFSLNFNNNKTER